jgi:hypothetical protein
MVTEDELKVEDSRALLTEADRHHISSNTKDNTAHQSVSRVRNRIKQELQTDMEVLEEHHTELYNEVLGVIEDV